MYTANGDYINIIENFDNSHNKIVIITFIGTDLSKFMNNLSSKINLIEETDNQLYPNELLEKYGKNIKVIFITRNVKNILNSLLQSEKYNKYLNTSSGGHTKILEEDTLNFEKLYDSYIQQNIFDVLFIKYEYLYSNHQGTKDMLSYFMDENLQNINFQIYNNECNDFNLIYGKSLQNKINSFEFFKHIENVSTRKFFVCSWGGCGSTTLCKYLNNFGKTYHIHDRYPKEHLCYPVNHKDSSWLPSECSQFSSHQIEHYNLKNYTFIFLIANPVKSIFSRFIKNKYCNYKEHLRYISCKDIELEEVIHSGKDLYKLNEFYYNYVNCKKKYNIYLINFDYIFENIDNINNILKIPKNKLFPKRIDKHYIYNDLVVSIYKNLSNRISKINFNLIMAINKTFNMITTTYNNISSKRLEETIYSINKCLDNVLIEKYFILLEVKIPNDNEKLYDTNLNKNTNFKGIIKDEFIKLLQHPKIEVYLIKTRPTYQSIFDFCNNFHNIIWILSNSDIHFPKWNNDKLKLLLNKNFDIESFVLTRYNIYNDLSNDWKTEKKRWYKGIMYCHNNVLYKSQHTKGCSIDSWIFKTPFNTKNINFNIFLGTPECDGMMNFQLSKIRKISNPCLDIISIHKHTNWQGNEAYKIISINGIKYTRKEYNQMMLKKGIDKKNIQFTEIKSNKSSKFYLVTTTYNNINSRRLEETIYSINKNLDNDLIEKYFILLEVEITYYHQKLYDTYLNKNTNFKGIIKDEFIALLQHPKIEIYLIKNRPSFKSIFNFCNNYHNIIWILTNSDIHFPIWNNNKLKLLLEKNYDVETFVITRYNIYDDLIDKIKTDQNGIYFIKNNIKYRTQLTTGASIDSWIFKTPLNIDKINLDFELGIPECDGRMNFQLSKIRKVSNPCLDIISIHKHNNWSPESYYKINYKGKIYTRKDFNKILDNIGLKRMKVPFSAVI